MLSKLLTCVGLMILFGCESKEYKKSDNKNIEIVQELNQGDSDSVINKLEEKENLTPRERSYLASAYSVKGGVDVFSLYHVLEMHLFKKNALEWSDLSKEKNPYIKFVKKRGDIDYEARSKKREAIWAKYDERIQAGRPVKPSLSEVYYYEYGGLSKSERYQKDDEYLKEKYDEIMKLNAHKRKEVWKKFYGECYKDYTNTCVGMWQLMSYYENSVEWETDYQIKKQRFIHPELQEAEFYSKSDWQMVVMNILWNTYEAIPILKQLPTLSNDQQDQLTLSLDQYKELIDNSEFQAVAVKNIAIMVGVSILSVYKNSFDLDDSESMEDMMCSFNPQVIIDNYPLLRKRAYFLADAVPENQMGKFKDYYQRKDEFKSKLPEHLTQEEIDNFHHDVDEFKMKHCFQVEEEGGIF